MEVADLPGILRDCMLPVAGRLPSDSWARAFLNEEEIVNLLPRLAATCTQWRDAVHGLTGYAVLRIAVANFVQVKGRGISGCTSRARKRDMVFICSMYEHALFLLSRLWALQQDLEERLRCAPLADLCTAELQSLHSTLQDGWGRLEIEIARGAKLKPSSRNWITPLHRAL